MTPSAAVEFLVWLLIVAALIAILAKRLNIPYTVSLVIGGLILSVVHLPILSPLQRGNRPEWLTPDVILILFLPALVFEGSVKLDVRELFRNSVPLALLANAGTLIAAFVTGYVVHWWMGLPLFTALLFGCIVSATDPISVLAIFKDLRVDKRLSILLEGESLLNDGTAVVLFGILLGATATNKLDMAKGVAEYFLAVAGGAVLGVILGYLAARITGTLDDPQVEITLTTILAYGSYLLAYHLHLSGVIATASAGLIFGNLGVKRGMSVRTQTAVQSFWEYISFVMNSLVFLLIGLEIHVDKLLQDWAFVLLAIGAVLLGRLLSVYLLIPLSNRFSEKIPFRWQHVAVWGGLRGALALALALSLNSEFPYREAILNLTFGVVIFSIIVQGLSLKPLLRILGLADGERLSQTRA
jgi:CPA1 family monovalent cation:H+ antiporter